MRDLLGGRSQQLTAHLRGLTTANLMSLGGHAAQHSHRYAEEDEAGQHSKQHDETPTFLHQVNPGQLSEKSAGT